MPDPSDTGETLVDRLDGGRIVAARYRLEKLLGRGGMGVVWLASDDILHRHVALKFVTEVLAHDRSAIEDLKHETTRCLDLTHPRIVRIYDFVQDGPLAGISMEFVDGKTLSELRVTRKYRCFEPAELCTWIEQMAEALDYAHHEAKVVHRDLKPSNVMLTQDGQIKVSDFGIARSISDSLTRVSAQAGKVSGTLGYMSPQQAHGAPPQAADDIYAVGAMLFELLTGKPPFYGPPALVFQQLLNVPAPSVNERRREFSGGALPAVPDAWEAAISRCLEKDPALRPRSVDEIREALTLRETSVGVPPVPLEGSTQRAAESGGTTPAPATFRHERRSPALLSWAAAFAAAGIAIGGGIWWSQQRETGEPTRTAATPAPSPSPARATPEPAPLPPPPQPKTATLATPTPIPTTPAPAISAPATPLPATPEPHPRIAAPPPPRSTPKPSSQTRTVAPVRKATPKPVARSTTPPPQKPRSAPVARVTPRPATPAPNPPAVSQEERDRSERVRRAFQKTRPGGGL